MAVDKHRFEEMFDHLVAEPLLQLGFERNGKSLFLVQKDIAVSLIRLGGRMVYPGAISHLLCFRHTFLPNLYGEDNFGFEREVFSYPIKLKPLTIKPEFGSSFQYCSANLHYEVETLEFLNKSERQVLDYLLEVLEAVQILLHWAQETTPGYLARQIETNGESAWIEKLWLNSYASHKTI